MIREHQKLTYQNVVTKGYHVHYSEFDQVMKEFLTDVDKAGAHIKGPFYYALWNVPMDEKMLVELSIALHDTTFSSDDEDMRFHSYVEIDPMVVERLSENYEKLTEFAVGGLINYMIEHNLEQSTPIYFIYSGDESVQFVDVKIGTKYPLPESILE